ncbi:MAG TPA: BrnA antitoxin family protein [Rhodopseudomonas sp.]|uniref:BrnA antitoxin family protein n=1 Tax=Rhodopseudomonas sp. TaxID=1078 RepID=UPI002ED7EEC8
MPRKTKQPVFDDDNPEWTKADFAKATRFDGIKAKDLTPELLARIPGKRGVQKAPTKVAVSIRLSPEVIAHFKAQGAGWQSRIDEALRKIAKAKAV